MNPEPKKPFGKVSAFFLALGISCIVNLFIHIPFIYFTGVKMHMGPLSMLSSITFFASFYCLSRKCRTSLIIASAACGIILITILDVPSSGSRASALTQTPETDNRAVAPQQQSQIPPASEQKKMSSAAAPVGKGFDIDPDIESKLQQTASQIYREYPFLDGENESANSKAMSEVSQTCADLVKRGTPLTEALRIAASQVGPKYGPSDEKKRTKEVYEMSPRGNVPIDSFCIMLSKPVPPYNPHK